MSGRIGIRMGMGMRIEVQIIILIFILIFGWASHYKHKANRHLSTIAYICAHSAP